MCHVLMYSPEKQIGRESSLVKDPYMDITWSISYDHGHALAG